MPSPDTVTTGDERVQGIPSVSSTNIRSSFAESYQNTASQSVGQYEHITVMTQLQQQAATYALPQPVVASSCTSGYTTNVNSLHICPASTITQQVQLTVPALNSVSGSNAYPQARISSISNQDQDKLVCANQRQNIPQPTILTVVGNSMGTVGEDGPTVRQHLQYQQKARMRHQLETQEKLKADELTLKEKIDAGDTHQQNWQYVTATVSPVLQKTPIQRIYTLRGATLQKSPIGIDRLRQQQVFAEKQQQQSNAEQIRASLNGLQNVNNVQKLRSQPSGISLPVIPTQTQLKPAVYAPQNDTQLGQKRYVQMKRESAATTAQVCFTANPSAEEQVASESDRSVTVQKLNILGPNAQLLTKACDERRAQPFQQNVQPVVKLEQFNVRKFDGECSMNEDFTYPNHPQVSSSVQKPNERNTLGTQAPNESSLTQDLNEATYDSYAHVSQSRQRITRMRMVPPGYDQHSNKDYSLRIHWLKRTTKALIYKNAALCDEVARLNQRIQTVTEERKFLAKRLQHFERNRVRRILSKIKKRKASELAAQINPSQSGCDPSAMQKEIPRLNPPSASSNAELEESDNDSEKTPTSSYAASPITSSSAHTSELVV